MEYEGVSIFRLLGFLGHNFMDSLFVFINSLFRCKFMLKSDQEQLTLMNNGDSTVFLAKSDVIHYY